MCGPAGSCVSKLDGYPCQELSVVKGLCHVVGGSLQEQIRLAGRVCLCTDHNNGDIRKGGKEVPAGKARKHQIKESQVGLFCGQDKYGLCAGIGAADEIARTGEQFLQHVPYVAVIFNHQYLFHNYLENKK